MKLINLFFATICITFLTSCSSIEDGVDVFQNIENAETSQLKSYTLKRNTDGSYQMDFDVDDNTLVNTYKNTDNSNDVILSQGSPNSRNNQETEFTLDNNLLKINILEANNGKKSYISVEDEDIDKSVRGVSEFLYDYSITKHVGGNFTLDFEVNDNVVTDFVYDKVNKTYEIHLESGNSKTKKFSRELNIPENDILKIHFINHKFKSKPNRIQSVGKPRVVIHG